MSVEIVYASAKKYTLLAVTLKLGAKVIDAIRESSLLTKYPEIDLTVNKVGIWGKIGTVDDILKDGDRVEIYRHLIISPIEARKIRARNSKKQSKI